MTSWDDRVVDGVDPSQLTPTGSVNQPNYSPVDLDEILSNRPTTMVAAQLVDAQDQVIHFFGNYHGSDHFKIGQLKSEFHFPEQGYLSTVSGV